MKIASFHALFVHSICDLYDAEHQLLEALPKMAEACTSSELKSGFETHLTQTEGQVKRLEKIFKLLDKEPRRAHCPAMKGLLEEGKEAMENEMPDEVRDCAIIGAARRVEHYEQAGYASAIAMATEMGHDEIVELLLETYNEEAETDELLADAAESEINPAAMEAASGME